jgi:CRP-like cAMP-binding protein
VANLLTLTKMQPLRQLEAGEILLEAGEAGGELYVLEKGRLSVVRDGVEIATISEPGSLIGEMSVLLGVDHSATVTAKTPAEVRVIEGAIDFLEATPLVALHVATVVCQRLDATSALLVKLKKDGGRTEPGLLERIFGAVTGTSIREDT